MECRIFPLKAWFSLRNTIRTVRGNQYYPPEFPSKQAKPGQSTVSDDDTGSQFVPKETNVDRRRQPKPSRTFNKKTGSQKEFNQEKLKEFLDKSALLRGLDQDKKYSFSTPSYPKELLREVSEAEKDDKFDWKERHKGKSVVLFPGQGSQFVGMGKELLKFPQVRRIYADASDIFGFDVLEMCLNGPDKLLNQTIHQQAAVFVSSVASVERFKDEFPAAYENCIATAGFSIGEYTALWFAGVLEFETGMIRSKAMQDASEMVPSAMATVMYHGGHKCKESRRAAKEYMTRLGIDDPVCTVASYLFPECHVVAGHEQGIKFIFDHKRDFRIDRVKRLPVSGAFHTKLMQDAANELTPLLKQVNCKAPIIKVYANHDARLYSERSFLIKLKKQITTPVKWEQIMYKIYSRTSDQGQPNTYEIGPGTQLKMMLSRTNARAARLCRNVSP